MEILRLGVLALRYVIGPIILSVRSSVLASLGLAVVCAAAVCVRGTESRLALACGGRDKLYASR